MMKKLPILLSLCFCLTFCSKTTTIDPVVVEEEVLPVVEEIMPPTETSTPTVTPPPTDTVTSTTTSTSIGGNAHPINAPVILGYFPSWSETYAGPGQGSKLRDIPPFVNHVFLSFAKPNMRYEKGSFDLSGTGIEVPYSGCDLKESVSILREKGINVILSVGGETYWRDASSYEIIYTQIKDLVDDIGFAGIDWDFEPYGSFTNIGNETNVAHFIAFFDESRAIMPKSEGYILACAPAGGGALGGQVNNDTSSPYRFENRNSLTGENDDNLYQGTVPTNGINLFGFSSTGHMIPVFEAVGSKIDLVAFQGYNTGASTNRKIMYDAYTYYANKYDFTIAAGVHYPEEPWGPYFTYTHENVADLSNYISNHPEREGSNDGIMIWQILLAGNSSSAYSYLNTASKALNGSSPQTAINEANDFLIETFSGLGIDCMGEGGGTLLCEIPEYQAANEYQIAGTQVVYNCKIWKSKWWVNPNEVPGENEAWEAIGDCNEGEGCGN